MGIGFFIMKWVWTLADPIYIQLVTIEQTDLGYVMCLSGGPFTMLVHGCRLWSILLLQVVHFELS